MLTYMTQSSCAVPGSYSEVVMSHLATSLTRSQGAAAAPVAHRAPHNSYPPGSRFPLLPGIHSRVVTTPRLTQHLYESGPASGEPVVLLHANASSGRFYEELMQGLPDYHLLAPDLRGFGASEAAVVDATRGMRDFSDDVHALTETLGIARFHLLGWSMGGNVAMQYAIDHAERVLSLTLLAPGSPYGYGGTHGASGRPNHADFAGSGAGLVHGEVTARIRARDATGVSVFSPRSILRQVYLKRTTRMARHREDVLVEQMLMMATGERHYPGDSAPSLNWPFTGPGRYGPNNALSPKYLNQRQLLAVRHRMPILWVRGADDLVVADSPLATLNLLTHLWLIPQWFGCATYAPQPMVTQLRYLLRQYAARGGSYREEVIADCGHSPHLERPQTLLALLRPFWHAARSAVATPGARGVACARMV
jgi:pimeloyl-ACP methyl ester carboxylesterase